MQARRFGPLTVDVPVLGIGTWKMEHDDRTGGRRGVQPVWQRRLPDEQVLDDIAARAKATPRLVALAFLLRHRSVFAIPKSANAAHVDELSRAASVTLDADDLRALDDAFPREPWRGLPTL